MQRFGHTSVRKSTCQRNDGDAEVSGVYLQSGKNLQTLNEGASNAPEAPPPVPGAYQVRA